VNALSAEADAHAVLSIQRPARQLIKPPIAPPADEVIERLAHATEFGTADHIQRDGDDIVVQGQLHFYRLSRTTGRIHRVTDGAALKLNWSAIPDQLRLVLHRECDADQQVALQASLLVHDGVFGRYFEAK
jgi:hypothetical protein